MKNNRRAIGLIALIVSTALFTLGLSFPIIATKQRLLGFNITYDELYLFSSIELFIHQSEWFLAIIITVFTVILPAVKYFELYNRAFDWIHFNARFQKFLFLADKWSMLDVFIVALLIMNFKLDSNIVKMDIKIGTTFLAVSILLRMVSSTLLGFKTQLNSLK